MAGTTKIRITEPSNVPRISTPCHPPCLPCPPKHRIFQFENMTITSPPPLLKIYYWEYFDIDGLNAKLRKPRDLMEHTIRLPTRQINNRPLKIILWIRNTSTARLELQLKRIQNCNCCPMETRVGFNQFRRLFHCPHRRLIHILQERMELGANDLVAMSVVFYYFLYGENRLTYEIRTNDDRTIMLHFIVKVACSDLVDFVLTKELLPMDIREHRRFVQPIWVSNITQQHLNFSFSSRERDLRLLNPNLTVPRYSVWPLMIQYRPSDFTNELELKLVADNMRTEISIYAEGIMGNRTIPHTAPMDDYPCADFPYNVHPNKVDFVLELQEEGSQMVAVHNHNQKCVEFRWQNYIINDLFEVTFEPNTFRLKGHHSKLVVVNIRTFKRPLHFTRVPLALEVHRILDKATRIAKELLEEVESIDDPKWKKSSYMMHTFLHLNIKVNFKREEPPVTDKELQAPYSIEKPIITIFERFYWDYLSRSDFMRNVMSKTTNIEANYVHVLTTPPFTPKESNAFPITRGDVRRLINQLIAESVRELSKNWMFVPFEPSEEGT